LPTPPVPVRVSSLTSRKKVLISPSSRSRLNRDVEGVGRLDFETVVCALAVVTLPRFGTADNREARSFSESSSASAIARTVCGKGRFLSPRSNRLIALALRPALEASSSCVSPAASRSCRKRVPKGAGCFLLCSRTPFPLRPQDTSGTGARATEGSPLNWHAPKYSRTVPAVWVVCRHSGLHTQGIGKHPREEKIQNETSWRQRLSVDE
jgi:hypothetical protein